MKINLLVLDLLGRFLLINVAPFFLVFHLVMRRRKKTRKKYDELELICGEIQVIGLMGYFVILSIYFFSIPAIQYIDRDPGFDVKLIEPDGVTVFVIAFISYWLVTTSIYLKYKRRWAYMFLFYIFLLLLAFSLFSVLEIGAICFVPIVVFSYFLYCLRKKSLREKVFWNS